MSAPASIEDFCRQNRLEHCLSVGRLQKALCLVFIEERSLGFATAICLVTMRQREREGEKKNVFIPRSPARCMHCTGEGSILLHPPLHSPDVVAAPCRPFAKMM